MDNQKQRLNNNRKRFSLVTSKHICSQSTQSSFGYDNDPHSYGGSFRAIIRGRPREVGVGTTVNYRKVP